jgi:hypothetical protein
MPVITPQHFVTEDRESGDVCGPGRTHWISDAAGLTQFGALIEVLEPGSLSSLKHWHSAEDELIYVLDGETTVHGLQHPSRTLTLLPCQPRVGRDRAAMERTQEAGDSLEPIEAFRAERDDGRRAFVGA